MDARLYSISKALAQAAIDAYNSRPVFLYHSSTDSAVRCVYGELIIGAKCKTAEWRLAKNVTRVALIAYWQSTTAYIDHYKLQNIETDSLFRRAVFAVNASLRKMIRETNYQRRLQHKIHSH